MKTSFSIFLLVLLAAFLGCAANLQRPSIQEQPLAPGDRLRVSYSNGVSKRFVGNLVALRADTLFLKNHTVPLASSVTKVEVSLGSAGTALGGLVGLGLIGFLGGAFIGGIIADATDDCADLDCLPVDFSGLFLGGFVGGILGAGVGIANSGERWEELPDVKYVLNQRSEESAQGSENLNVEKLSGRMEKEVEKNGSTALTLGIMLSAAAGLVAILIF